VKKLLVFFALSGGLCFGNTNQQVLLAATVAAGGSTPAFGAENTRGSETASTGTTVIPITGAGITSGNAAVIFVSWESSTETLTSVTDSKGNTWTLGTPAVKSGDGNNVLARCVLASSLTSSDTVTLTWGTAGFSNRYWMIAYATGTGATQPDAQNSGNSTFGTSINAPTITPVAAKTIVFQSFLLSSGVTYSGGTWTGIGTFNGVGSYTTYYLYKVYSSAPGAVSPDGTLSGANATAGVNISLK